MRDNKNLNSGKNRREYIPNDEIDREERDDRNHRKGSIVNVFLGAVIVISLLAFLFILLDSGILAGRTETLYGSPEAVASANQAQAEGQAETEAALKAEAEAEAAKKAEEEEAAKAEEEARKAEEEAAAEAARKEREEEAAEKREEREQKQREEQQEMQEALENEEEVLSGDYILADSNARYYSESEIEQLTDREVIFALNEIYARKGRMFTNDEIRSYFESKSWYKGTIPPEEFDADQESHFNEYELANLSLLVSVAEQRGLR